MSATLYKFPTMIKIDENTIERYSELIEKLSEVNFRQDQLIEASKVSRVFSGCHNIHGSIPEQYYKKLLAFYNAPSQDNWNEIKDLRILGRIRACEIISSIEINYLNEEFNLVNYPTSEDFYDCFMKLRESILLTSSKLISQYKEEMSIIEMMYPSISKSFKY